MVEVVESEEVVLLEEVVEAVLELWVLAVLVVDAVEDVELHVEVVLVVVLVDVVELVVVESEEEELVEDIVLLHEDVVEEQVVVQAFGYALGQFCLNIRLSISTLPPLLLVS